MYWLLEERGRVKYKTIQVQFWQILVTTDYMEWSKSLCKEYLEFWAWETKWMVGAKERVKLSSCGLLNKIPINCNQSGKSIYP